jgi:hypothetical protein
MPFWKPECSKRRMLFESFLSTSARNLRSRLTVAVAKWHFEGSEFKKDPLGFFFQSKYQDDLYWSHYKGNIYSVRFSFRR